MIKIEIWSDYTCPFCYIGNRNLEIAMARFGYEKHIKLEYKSFRLNSTSSSQDEKTVGSILMETYGMTGKQMELLVNEIHNLAKEADLSMSLSGIKYFDTVLAHRLAKFAEKQGKAKEMIASLFHGYFTEAINIEDKSDLIKLAVQIGLNKEDVDYALSMNCYKKEVVSDEALAEEIGVSGVPFYVFNESLAIKGSQSVEIFLSVLEEVIDSDGELMKNIISNNEGQRTYCTGTDCEKEAII